MAYPGTESHLHFTEGFPEETIHTHSLAQSLYSKGPAVTYLLTSPPTPAIFFLICHAE